MAPEVIARKVLCEVLENSSTEFIVELPLILLQFPTSKSQMGISLVIQLRNVYCFHDIKVN